MAPSQKFTIPLNKGRKETWAEHVFHAKIGEDTYLISTFTDGPNEDGRHCCLEKPQPILT